MKFEFDEHSKLFTLYNLGKITGDISEKSGIYLICGVLNNFNFGCLARKDLG